METSEVFGYDDVEEEQTCEMCGQPIGDWDEWCPNYDNVQKFCVECHPTHRSVKKDAELNRKIRSATEKFWCEECGDCFLASRNDAKYCSIECYGKGQRGEAYDDEREYGPRWTYIRSEILQRDGYECQRCGITQDQHVREYNESLHVHHITPWVEFGDTATERNKNAHESDNLVTLCSSCHAIVENE